ncbi:MAG: hypothetical protein KIH01_04600 [Candidatus Freyarchaeota archaeon]|nr:hypothetical protein [Candidatus Jordarchaeia archaeon]
MCGGVGCAECAEFGASCLVAGVVKVDVFELVEKEVERLSRDEERELRRLNLSRERFALMLKEMLEAAKEKGDRQRLISEILLKYTN